MKPATKDFIYSICVQVIVITAILRPEDIPWYTGQMPSGVLPAWLVGGLTVAWWYALAWNLTAALELFVWTPLFGSGESGLPRQRKLLTDMVHILIYLGATAIIAIRVFDQPMSGLFATTGVVAIVLGLALQSTLGDFFAGLALNLERPFKAGDWITLDGNLQGIVLLTNWRSTHLRTRTADEIVLPNSAVARARVAVHSRPTRVHLTHIEVPLRYGFDADEVETALREAACTAPGVLAQPAPVVLLHEMRHPVVLWRVYVHIDDFARLVVIRGEVSKALYARLQTGSLNAFLPRDSILLAGGASPPPAAE